MMYTGPERAHSEASQIGPARPAQAVPAAYITPDSTSGSFQSCFQGSIHGSFPGSFQDSGQGSFLDWIYLSCPTSVVQTVAACPSTPPAILRELAFHPDKEVRAALADNPNVPAEALSTLCRDEDPDIRYGLAENHRLPEATLALLACDDNPYVAARAARTLARLETGPPNVTALPEKPLALLRHRPASTSHKYARAI